MNTDNWREEMDKAAEARYLEQKGFVPQHIDKYHSFKDGALWMRKKLEATLKEKDKEIATLRAELEALKTQNQQP